MYKKYGLAISALKNRTFFGKSSSKSEMEKAYEIARAQLGAWKIST